MFGRQSEPKSPEELVRRGDDYRIGEREEQSFEQALQYYRKAASKGYPFAMYMVGTMYESGHGLIAVLALGLVWRRR